MFAAILFMLVFASTAFSSTFYWPGYKWKTIHTEHFRIQYHQGERDLAYRVAVIAEEILEEMYIRIGHKPRFKIEMVLSDDTDDSNGSSGATPYNTVRLYMAAPDADGVLDDYDDWLRLLISHELTHTVHIDMASRVPLGLRYIFGRIITFNHFNPVFQIEGFAVMHETILSKGGGRGHSIYADMLTRGEWLSGDFPGLDRLSNWTSEWPHGYRPYVLGGMFHTWVYENVDDQAWYDIAQRHSGQLWPFFHDSNMRKASGHGLKKLYRAWYSWLDQKYTSLYESLLDEGITVSTQLTKTGQNTRRPVFSSDGKYLYYSENTGFRKGRINKINLDTFEIEKIKAVGTTNKVAYLNDGRIIWSEMDAYQTFKHYFDLHMLEPDKFLTEKMTEGLRAGAFAVHPNGNRILYIANRLERPHIGILDLETRETKEIYTPDKDADYIQFDQPTYSPDGKTVAMSVWHNDGNRDIFLFDPEKVEFTRVTFDMERDISPAFSPDGKYLLFSSGRTGVYNIYALEIETQKLFRITNVFTGAFDPAVSPDGSHLAYARYGPEGFDIHLTLMAKELWVQAPYVPLDDKGFGKCVVGRDIADRAKIAEGKYEETKYRAWRTIWPRHWIPAIGSVEGNLSLGGTITGHDVLHHHSYNLQALYSWESEFLAYGASYTNAMLHPNFTVGGRHNAVYYGPVLREEDGTRRIYWEERNTGYVNMLYPLNTNHSIYFEYLYQLREALTDLDEVEFAPIEDGDFAGIRLGWLYSHVSSYRESISPADGVSGSITYTGFTAPLGSDYEVHTLLASQNFYVGMPFWNHVFAGRMTAGIAGGEKLYLRAFRLGGFTNDQILAQPSENSVFLRGYNRASRRGQRVAAGSLEYRLPLWRPERGISTWPVFLDTFTLIGFGDVGTAWTDTFDPDRNDILPSAGGELHVRIALAYYYAITLRFGAAYGFFNPDTIGGFHWIWTLGGLF